MKISAINSTQNFNKKTENTKKPVLEKFYTGIKNSADMNDTVVVPRTIFKGYLAFIASTTMGTLASLTKKLPKVSGFCAATSALTALWGTYSFVRPYVFANTSLDANAKKEDK